MTHKPETQIKQSSQKDLGIQKDLSIRQCVKRINLIKVKIILFRKRDEI
jgi:hypothetical protein